MCRPLSCLLFVLQSSRILQSTNIYVFDTAGGVHSSVFIMRTAGGRPHTQHAHSSRARAPPTGPSLTPLRGPCVAPVRHNEGHTQPRQLGVARAVEFDESVSDSDIAKFERIAQSLVSRLPNVQDQGVDTTAAQLCAQGARGANLADASQLRRAQHTYQTSPVRVAPAEDLADGEEQAAAEPSGMLPFGASPADVAAIQAARSQSVREASTSAADAEGFATTRGNRPQKRIPDAALPKVSEQQRPSVCEGQRKADAPSRRPTDARDIAFCRAAACVRPRYGYVCSIVCVLHGAHVCPCRLLSLGGLT